MNTPFYCAGDAWAPSAEIGKTPIAVSIATDTPQEQTVLTKEMLINPNPMPTVIEITAGVANMRLAASGALFPMLNAMKTTTIAMLAVSQEPVTPVDTADGLTVYDVIEVSINHKQLLSTTGDSYITESTRVSVDMRFSDKDQRLRAAVVMAYFNKSASYLTLLMDTAVLGDSFQLALAAACMSLPVTNVGPVYSGGLQLDDYPEEIAITPMSELLNKYNAVKAAGMRFITARGGALDDLLSTQEAYTPMDIMCGAVTYAGWGVILVDRLSEVILSSMAIWSTTKKNVIMNKETNVLEYKALLETEKGVDHLAQWLKNRVRDGDRSLLLSDVYNAMSSYINEIGNNIVQHAQKYQISESNFLESIMSRYRDNSNKLFVVKMSIDDKGSKPKIGNPSSLHDFAEKYVTAIYEQSTVSYKYQGVTHRGTPKDMIEKTAVVQLASAISSTKQSAIGGLFAACIQYEGNPAPELFRIDGRYNQLYLRFDAWLKNVLGKLEENINIYSRAPSNTRPFAVPFRRNRPYIKSYNPKAPVQRTTAPGVRDAIYDIIERIVVDQPVATRQSGPTGPTTEPSAKRQRTSAQPTTFK